MSGQDGAYREQSESNSCVGSAAVPRTETNSNQIWLFIHIRRQKTLSSHPVM